MLCVIEFFPYINNSELRVGRELDVDQCRSGQAHRRKLNEDVRVEVDEESRVGAAHQIVTLRRKRDAGDMRNLNDVRVGC